MYVFIYIFYSFWLKCNMIQQGLCLEDGQGSLTSQSLSACKATQKKASGLPRSSIRAFVSLYKTSLTCVICLQVRIIKWWLSNQLPLWCFLRISRNGFEGQLCECNLCSFVLCRKKTFALSSTTYMKASWLIYVNETCVLLSLVISSCFFSFCNVTDGSILSCRSLFL